ncbi:MAG: MotB family protein [Rhizobiales bacterium]|nr:MotB family protein [Hyphomicrobiales bacterium]MBI3672766.1 MotB family protein [Hyphomicrobiales bacterium]
MSDTVGEHPEIVIIRRRAADDTAAHKGGAWKIAYADFVTAMMAFFLVMWLINAANEATRAQVASYFNPIKLTDSATGAKGLSDPKDVKNKDRKPGSASQPAPTAAEKAAEEKLLADPIKTLDKIAGQEMAMQAQSGKPVAGYPDATSDPFNPMSWQSLSDAATETAGAMAIGNARSQPKPVAAEQSDSPSKPIPVPKAWTKAAAQSPDQPLPPAETAAKIELPAKELKLVAEAELRPDSKPVGDRQDAAPAKAEVDAKAVAEAATAKKLAQSQDVKNEILRRLNLKPTELPANLEVVPTDEGLLISLTDKNDYGMFSSGSAEPDPRLIELVGVIATVLKDKPGYIVVRGHTDSRPFHNKRYDNWQLSSARAQMAYYMLVRGGLDEKRVRRIEGWADRGPKLAGQPDAAINRRIDILLGQDK